MPPPSDPRNLRAKWQRALEERRKAGASAPPLDVTPRPAVRTRRSDAGPLPEASAEAGRSSAPDLEASAEAAKSEASAEAAKPAAAKVAAVKPAAAKPAAVKVAAAKPAAAPLRVEAPAERALKDKDEEKGRGEEGAEGGRDAAKKAAPPAPLWSSIVAALVLVGGVGLALRTFIRPDDSPPEPSEEEPVASGSASAEPAPPVEPSRPAPRARCAEAAKDSFVIGDAPAPKPAATATDGEDPPEDDLAPFAVELGRGVKFANGFAVGSQREAEGGTVSMVATIGEGGEGGKLVRLARSRGDFDPPVVAAAGASVLAAMVEPNAGGRAIRVAKVDGERVTWGPELSEGHDESFAVDLAAAGHVGIVVWDDVPVGHERSVIELAKFDVESMHGSGARAVTPPTIDADLPRLARRPGGFWLAYMVHGEAPTEPTTAKDDSPEDAGAKKGRGKRGSDNPDDNDFEAAGEGIAHQWIELLPLDEAGLGTGYARAVTPKEGRVIGYDLAEGEDGRALILYREDDTPNGSNGGRVKVVAAELGGVGDPRMIAEEGVGAGVPQLAGGWVVIHGLSGPVQLAPMSPRGEMAGELAPEPLLRSGEVLASDGKSAFLVATPAGRAMKLGVVRCSR